MNSAENGECWRSGATAGAIRGGRLSRRWLWQRTGECAAFSAALALVVFGAGALQ